MADPPRREDADGGLGPAFTRGAEAPPALTAAELDALYGEVTQARRAFDRGPLGWLRSRPTGLRFGLLVGLGVAAALGVGLAAPRPDLGVYPPIRFWSTVAALGALAVWLGARAVRPFHRPSLAGLRRVDAPLVALAVLVAVALLPRAHVAHPASLVDGGLAAVRCVVDGLALALPVLLLGRALDRGGDETAWAAAVLAGVVANLALFLACPITATSHLLAGHVTVALLVLGAAVAFAPRR